MQKNPVQLLGLALLFVLGFEARAEEPATGSGLALEASGSRTASRWQSDHGAIRLGVSAPDVFTIAVTVPVYRALQVDVGAGTIFLASSVYARAGVAYKLLDTRGSPRRGWSVDALGLAGGRVVTGCFYVCGLKSVGPMANLGLEATYWFGRRAGVTLQVLGGATYQVELEPPVSDLKRDFRVTLGYAF